MRRRDAHRFTLRAAAAHTAAQTAARAALSGAALSAALPPSSALAETSAAASGAAPAASAASPAPAPLAQVPPAEAFGVNEAFRAMAFGSLSGAGWTRWTVQWFNVEPQPGPLNVHYFRDHLGRSILEAQVAAGVKVAAVVIGTPEWAAAVPGLKTGTSVPRGLYEPVFVDAPPPPEPAPAETVPLEEGAEPPPPPPPPPAPEVTPTADGRLPNPENPWASFMYRLAQRYAGLMDVFEIWNEVEIPATGSNAVYNTWAGSPADYYRLLAVAHEAVKAANPTARIVTSPYSYFKDHEEGNGQRLPWLDAFAASVRAGGAHVFDAFALNLYRNPHDLWDRFHGGAPQLLSRADTVGFRRRLDEMGAAGKPIWLSEINAMPYDDELPGWSAAAKNDGFRITQDEQASYVLQAYATALCAGYEKVFFQALQDDPYPVPDELWGLVRFHDDAENADPERMRPAFLAYHLAATYLGNADFAQLFVRTRPDPNNYKRYASRYEWAQHLATFIKGTQRAHVLWNGIAARSLVSLPARGASARLLDRYGTATPLPRAAGGVWNVTLEPASRHFKLFGGDPPGYHYVGGPTIIVVEEDVPPDAPVGVPGFRPA